MDHGDRETKGDDEMRKLIKGTYLITEFQDETLITLIPENGFSHEQTKRILDKNKDTSIILEHPKQGGTLYQYKQPNKQ